MEVHHQQLRPCNTRISAGIVYLVGCDEVFRGIRIADGKEVFEFPSGGYAGASPALLDHWAYFGTFSNEVLGADLLRRRIVWRYEHPERHFPFYSSAAVVADRIVVGGRDKLIHCLNAKTGKAIWTFATSARVDSSPAIAGDRVYVGSNDGRFYVLDLATGKKVWAFDTGSPLSASPAIATGRVVIGSQDGRLYTVHLTYFLCYSGWGGRSPRMARTVGTLPAGSRITDYISLGVITKFFPLEKVREALEAD